MRIIKKFLDNLIILISFVLFSLADAEAQSIMTIETGAIVEVQAGASICADEFIIEGLLTGEGNKCEEPLPVELTTFTAQVIGSSIKLQWETATEVNNFGFEIERVIEGSLWEKISFVEGHGNSNSPKQYSYIDEKPITGKSKYRLKQIDLDGKYEYSEEIEVEIEILNKYELSQNYPNPFNPSTTIKFSLAESGLVELEVYNTLGERVTQLINREMEKGNHTVEFNARNLPSGIYFYRLTAGNFVEVKRMILIK